jgi:hypothetical protein
MKEGWAGILWSFDPFGMGPLREGSRLKHSNLRTGAHESTKQEWEIVSIDERIHIVGALAISKQ